MSIKIRLGTVGIKDLIGSYIREHSNEIAIVGIMTAVLVGVTALSYWGCHAGINSRQALARAHR